MLRINKKILCLSVLSASVLSGCGDDNDPDVMAPPPTPDPDPVSVSYEVTVSNLTYAQPFSPVAVILHQDGHFWQIGESASVELETLAEGGDNMALLAMADVMVGSSGEGPIPPGQSETISITVEDITDADMSVATMLVNTNDAFTGLDSVNLAELAVGDSWSRTAYAYDAGTEANTEAMGTMPGPADGGSGFEDVRDDVGFVAMHPGVVSVDGGLSTSILTEAHRFDNPVTRIVITRTE